MLLDRITHSFGSGETTVTALDDVHLEVQPGEFVAVMGPSGSGKSTLLACAAGLLAPTRGTVSIGGRQLSGLNDDELTEVRRTQIGFVFQSYNLVPSLTALDNVRLPSILGGDAPDSERLQQLADRLGITDRLQHRPSQLSGGQQQRVAIARALSMVPSIVLADEPTGALDTASAHSVLDLLEEESKRGQSIVTVTHDPLVAERADRVLFLRDGAVARATDKLTAREISNVLLELIEGSAA
ncbi:ABC transporter ATP-binding protein [uncultured Agrococcus sp.]|uniref:ABC transporter ATP-binding protein n=1 Tax=uncultured Agrococcus sp. TaxID=382258 RepID=UPI0025F758E1|nr:ABC transporter ATP-binding protein [uncultured Agrococcus sp.]